MFITELRKIFSKRLVQVFIVIILLGNGILGYINENLNVVASKANAKSYVALQKDLELYSELEKVTYISNKLEYVNLIIEVMNYCKFGYDESDKEYFLQKYPNYSLEQCIKDYESQNYLKYTSNLFAEKSLYEEVQQEMNLCNGYSEYVEQVLERTLKMLKNIKDKESYTFQNLANTYLAFDSIQDVDTSYGSSRGIEFVCNCITTDLWALLFIFIVAVLLITIEREQNLLILVKSTRYGRIHLGINKLFVLYVSCIFVMLLQIENYILGDWMYGMGDLNRSIQSVPGYQGCTLPMSVFEFLLTYFGFKLFVYFMCASIIYLICAFFINSNFVYLVTMVVVVGCEVIYKAIDNNSNIVWIKEITPISLLKVNEILGQYKNLQLGEACINRMSFTIIVMLVICIIGSIVGVVVFAVKKEKQGKKQLIVFPFFRRVAEFTEKNTNSFCHELYKFCITQHGLIILLLSGILFCEMFQPMSAFTSGEEELYYRSFILDVTGPEESVSEDYWQLLEEQCRENYEKLSEEQDIQSSTNMRNALKAIERLKEKERYLETKTGSWYLYDVGYEVLTCSQSGYEISEQVSGIFIILVGVFCFVGIYSMDYQNNRIKLLRTTRYGRNILSKNKIIIGIFCTIVISAFAWIPQLIYILKTYSVIGIDAPAYSMEHLSWVPQWITIREYLILLYTIRFLGTIMMMLFSYAVVIRLKSFITSICAIMGFVLLPLGFYMLGVDFMKYVLFTPILLGNPLLLSGNMGIFIIILIQAIAMMAFSIRMIKAEC